MSKFINIINTETIVEEDISTDIDNINFHHLILHNDDYNTFDWVIQCLINILKHNIQQAEQCAYIVHFKGKCQVKSGSLDELKPFKDSLVDCGLNVTID